MSDGNAQTQTYNELIDDYILIKKQQYEQNNKTYKSR